MPMPPFEGEGSNKALYICFSGYRRGYCIRSIQGKTLFSGNFTPNHLLPPSSSDDPEAHASKSKRTEEEDQNQKEKTPPPPPPPDLEEVWSDHDNSLPLAMGCGRMGSKIYLVGGIRPYFVKDDPSTVPFYRSNDRYSKRVIVFDPPESGSGSGSGSGSYDVDVVPDMITPKCGTMVVAVGESLYVLAGIGSHNFPDPSFEVYNTKSSSWEALDCPIFLTPGRSKAHFGYAVIGSFIYVSTDKDSFRFDTQNRIWEPCNLFDGTFRGCSILRPQWVYDSRKLPFFHNHKADAAAYGGPPFGFYGQAVLFGDDILICCLRFQLVAYLMFEEEGGKKVVRRSQALSPQGLTIPSHIHSTCIAHFQNGFFCLVLTERDPEMSGPTYGITIKPFHLIKKEDEEKKTGGGLDLEMGEQGQEEDGKEEEFLHCEVVNEFNYTYNYEDSQGNTIWRPIGYSVN